MVKSQHCKKAFSKILLPFPFLIEAFNAVKFPSKHCFASTDFDVLYFYLHLVQSIF